MFKKVFAVMLAMVMMFSVSVNISAASYEAINDEWDDDFSVEEIASMSEEELEAEGFFPLAIVRNPVAESPYGLMAGEWGGIFTGYQYVSFKVPDGKVLQRVYFIGWAQDGSTGVTASIVGDNCNIGSVPLDGSYYRISNLSYAAGRTFGASISINNSSSACRIVLLGRGYNQ